MSQADLPAGVLKELAERYPNAYNRSLAQELFPTAGPASRAIPAPSPRTASVLGPTPPVRSLATYLAAAAAPLPQSSTPIQGVLPESSSSSLASNLDLMTGNIRSVLNSCSYIPGQQTELEEWTRTMSNQAKVFDDRACAALAELVEAKRSLQHATQTEVALGRDIMRLEVEAEFFKAMAATLRRDYETSTSFKGTMWQRSQEADRLRKAAEDEAVAERTRAEKALAA